MYNNQGYNGSYQNRYYSSQLGQPQTAAAAAAAAAAESQAPSGQQAHLQQQQANPDTQQVQQGALESNQQQQQQQPPVQGQQQSYYPSNASYSSYSGVPQNYTNPVSYTGAMYPSSYIQDSTTPQAATANPLSASSQPQSLGPQDQAQQQQQQQPQQQQQQQQPQQSQSQQQQANSNPSGQAQSNYSSAYGYYSQPQNMLDPMSSYASQMYQSYNGYPNSKLGYRTYPSGSPLATYPIYPDYNNQLNAATPQISNLQKHYNTLNIPNLNMNVNPGQPNPQSQGQGQQQPQQQVPAQVQQSQSQNVRGLPSHNGSTSTVVSNANSSGFQLSPNAGQIQPPGSRPKITTTMWEDEKTLCYQVEANGVSVVRRADNNMINGTKLLNVAKMTRGRRDGILKAEKTRYVVKIGSMHLKGVWIPFERALIMAQREGIADSLYPLFVKDIQKIIQQGTPTVKMGQYALNPKPSHGVANDAALYAQMNPQAKTTKGPNDGSKVLDRYDAHTDGRGNAAYGAADGADSVDPTGSAKLSGSNHSESHVYGGPGSVNNPASSTNPSHSNSNNNNATTSAASATTATDATNPSSNATTAATSNHAPGSVAPMMYPSYYNSAHQSQPSQSQLNPSQSYYYGGYYAQNSQPASSSAIPSQKYAQGLSADVAGESVNPTANNSGSGSSSRPGNPNADNSV